MAVNWDGKTVIGIGFFWEDQELGFKHVRFEIPVRDLNGDGE